MDPEDWLAAQPDFNTDDGNDYLLDYGDAGVSRRKSSADGRALGRAGRDAAVLATQVGGSIINRLTARVGYVVVHSFIQVKIDADSTDNLCSW